MWDENSVLYSDLSYMTEADFIDWKQLRGKTFYITGGTGLIGYYLIQTLLYRNAKQYRIGRVLVLTMVLEALPRYMLQPQVVQRFSKIISLVSCLIEMLLEFPTLTVELLVSTTVKENSSTTGIKPMLGTSMI